MHLSGYFLFIASIIGLMAFDVWLDNEARTTHMHSEEEQGCAILFSRGARILAVALAVIVIAIGLVQHALEEVIIWPRSPIAIIISLLFLILVIAAVVFLVRSAINLRQTQRKWYR